MALSLHIHDEKFANELLSLPTPISFIDFETFTASPSPIPGTNPNNAIPCQWSNHILYTHGLDWDGNLEHDEFLWMGDWGVNPIYAFVESLYRSTEYSNTIVIYSHYEKTCLKLCQSIAENDMAAYNSGEIGYEYTVMNADGEYVPLMDIAPKIGPWCDIMMGKMYDMLDGKPVSDYGGVKHNIQTPDLHNSNSIKAVCPVCMDEYSRTGELFQAFNIPETGYDGLRAMGCIAKGDECTSKYVQALNRPPILTPEGYYSEEVAPFDYSIASQCLIYCCLDTLSMVLVYLAVLEATQNYMDAIGQYAGQYAYFPDGMYHGVIYDGDANEAFRVCDEQYHYPCDPNSVSLVTQAYLDNMNIRDFYANLCPHCRAAWTRRY